MIFGALKAVFVVFVILIAVPTALYFGLTKYKYQVTPEQSMMEVWPSHIPRDPECESLKIPLDRGAGAELINEYATRKSTRGEINCIMSKSKYHLVQEKVSEDKTTMDTWLVISVGFTMESTATVRLYYNERDMFIEAK